MGAVECGAAVAAEVGMVVNDVISCVGWRLLEVRGEVAVLLLLSGEVMFTSEVVLVACVETEDTLPATK